MEQELVEQELEGVGGTGVGVGGTGVGVGGGGTGSKAYTQHTTLGALQGQYSIVWWYDHF